MNKTSPNQNYVESSEDESSLGSSGDDESSLGTREDDESSLGTREDDESSWGTSEEEDSLIDQQYRISYQNSEDESSMDSSERTSSTSDQLNCDFKLLMHFLDRYLYANNEFMHNYPIVEHTLQNLARLEKDIPVFIDAIALLVHEGDVLNGMENILEMGEYILSESSFDIDNLFDIIFVNCVCDKNFEELGEFMRSFSPSNSYILEGLHLINHALEDLIHLTYLMTAAMQKSWQFYALRESILSHFIPN